MTTRTGDDEGSMMMIDPCLAVNGAGVEYREFSCVYPQLEGFYGRYDG